MLGNNVKEISIKDKNWEQAATITQILVDNSYAVMTTREEDLIIINYVYAGDYDLPYADRNFVSFMSNDELEDVIDGIVKECGDDDDNLMRPCI